MWLSCEFPVCPPPPYPGLGAGANSSPHQTEREAGRRKENQLRRSLLSRAKGSGIGWPNRMEPLWLYPPYSRQTLWKKRHPLRGLLHVGTGVKTCGDAWPALSEGQWRGRDGEGDREAGAGEAIFKSVYGCPGHTPKQPIHETNQNKYSRNWESNHGVENTQVSDWPLGSAQAG